MVKIYKFNNKLVVYLPFEVIKGLNLEADDEIDFFKYNEKSFIFAKKSDVTSMLLGTKQEPQKQPQKEEQKEQPRKEAPPRMIQVEVQYSKADLTPSEVAVLKKLDTIRYPMRTVGNVDKILNPDDKEALKNLLKKKAVAIFKSKEGSQLYSISKGVYDQYLMRKKSGAVSQPVQQARPPQIQSKPPQQQARPISKPMFQSFQPDKKPDFMENDNVKKLEKDGYIVLQTESEAAGLSMSLEESIRRGQVLGTRAFNKKFYIVLRPFLEKRAELIVKELRGGDKNVEEIASKIKLDEDAVRAILYLMSENGDVSEKRRDTFTLA